MIAGRQQHLGGFEPRLLDEAGRCDPDLVAEHPHQVTLADHRPTGHRGRRMVGAGVGDEAALVLLLPHGFDVDARDIEVGEGVIDLPVPLVGHDDAVVLIDHIDALTKGIDSSQYEVGLVALGLRGQAHERRLQLVFPHPGHAQRLRDQQPEALHGCGGHGIEGALVRAGTDDRHQPGFLRHRHRQRGDDTGADLVGLLLPVGHGRDVEDRHNRARLDPAEVRGHGEAGLLKPSVGAGHDVEGFATEGLTQDEGLGEGQAFAQHGQGFLIDLFGAVGKAQLPQAFEQEFSFQPGLTLPGGGLLQQSSR